MNSRKPVILCVDDQPTNLRLLDAILFSQNYEVCKAENGAGALEFINNKPVDLVLLDVMMPGMNGFDVCRVIKSNEKLRHIPVILITALTAKEERIKGIEAGAEDFISKPFDKGEVLARTKMLLKMKELNDRLTQSYDNILSLTAFGEQAVKTFSPMNFKLESKIEDAFSQILQQDSSSLSEKPAIIIMRSRDKENKFIWQKFRFISGKLTTKIIDPKIELTVQEPGKSRKIVANESALTEEFSSFCSALSPFDIIVENMVGYLFDSISVFALNYGRDVTNYDAAVLNSLVVQTFFFKSLSDQILETEQAFEYIVYSLARASEANDEDTGNHILRVGEYSAIIAEALNMPEPFIKAIRLQATLHDVGKIHISPAILKKAGGAN